MPNDARTVDSFDLRSEPPDPGAEHDRTHEGEDAPAEVDNTRPSKVLELPENQSGNI